MSASKSTLFAGAAFVAGIAFAAGTGWTAGSAFAADPPPAAGPKTLHVVATVNGEPITRDSLAAELIEDYGAQQLDLMINRKIVEQACRAAKVEVSDKEVEKDIENTLAKTRVKRTEFMDLLAKQGMTFSQYRRDRVWPKLAMVKLVKDKVKVTDEDLKKAFEANYGPKVECRMIAVKEMSRAQDLWERLMKEEKGEKRLKLFEDMVKEYSVDAATRSLAGKIQPFNMHSSNPELEKAIFGLKEGELSSIMHVADANMMFLCVAHLPPVPGVTMDTKPNPEAKQTIKQMLYEGIFTKMLQYEADQVFAEARKKTQIDNFLTSDFRAENAHIATQPAKQEEMKR